MASPLEIIARREAELDDLSRARSLSSAEVAEAERLKARKRVVLLRLPRQIAATERKLERLRSIYADAQVAA
ncbi:hypothetical protein FHS51_001719 [Sphingobium wenxiniae]|uniref:Uncharacterized protein n=1 Tax=Sphingobium wenxiniae (strain DSM 21828 / CGMCC 1.7748 / JZ-1) TaxID=595605 RepID=A0A562KCT8_SPHWJ|nr:hypothetical protein [Sphingobium wenxiniae]MBB6191492.1 hypothetical protein [Sphingobium wenxiniae]TWH93217.1 hypothetical protein IQ35_02124 [Sphingobium wenxiniae]